MIRDILQTALTRSDKGSRLWPQEAKKHKKADKHAQAGRSRGRGRFLKWAMERTQWYIGSPNGVVLCVDDICGRQLCGRSYHAYSCESESFRSMDEAVFQLEQLYDSLNFPRQTTVMRTFAGEGRRKASGRERTKIMADEELLERHGDLGTFIIRVQHRQNSSWQGRITWMEKNQTVNFRSIWEMVKLVAEALDTANGQEDAEEPCWPVKE